MSYEHLLTELDSNGIFTIILNRPKALNALSHELLSELQDVFKTIAREKDIKGVLITGQGEKAFCAGADISGLTSLNEKEGKAFAAFGQSVFRQIECSKKPVVAAINGFAFGGGCELAMSTHLRLSSRNAKFGQPEVKLGVIPGYGGTQRLSRLVGKGRAIDLCLTGRFIDAETALNWGLITHRVDQKDLMTEAKKLLTMILGMGPLAVHYTQKSIDEGFDLPLDEALALEATYFGKTCATKDKAEGVAAFLDKRQAEFAGE